MKISRNTLYGFHCIVLRDADLGHSALFNLLVNRVEVVS